MGREQHAMCWHHRNATKSHQLSASHILGVDGKQDPTSPYWQCGQRLFDLCAQYLVQPEGVNTAKCKQCGKGLCPDRDLNKLCEPTTRKCKTSVHQECGHTIVSNGTQADNDFMQCLDCSFKKKSEDPLRQAYCNASIVVDACLVLSGADSHGSGMHDRWGRYLRDFACLMDGTWYSNTVDGRCNSTRSDEDCWWRLKETRRTINQTCADLRVQQAIIAYDKHQRGGQSCWNSCQQPHNTSSVCYLDCLFTTILGDKNTGSMPAELITNAFENAFRFSNGTMGGCPSVHIPPHLRFDVDKNPVHTEPFLNSISRVDPFVF